ncbi:capsular exopolysaccharide synthesis family protein [Pullulanibacillus pueri]|uniref:non-specific protein-tyrosine kinase n=1 Tax=Pullulanibacillus pueri TaxID=1437324 RepID=A0A8J3EMR2_9BACL|nr:CpsD/CapB family tyrosine-protein kinase [Pullulanibacillus pueri]MBM7682421.1 capsular exopolysaccharide synthesis family protein [Pullulanibacillus pueri]GGH81705.1 tyrosine protein kinase [Pullulanibacillus pueri]
MRLYNERVWKAFKRKSLVSYYYQGSKISEQYRKIYAKIKFSSSDHLNHIIVVTSPDYKEGKTTTTVNLGTSIAQLGEKVLIVDADIRKPTLHRLFNLNNDIGLTNILQDQKSLDDVIKKTVIDTLDIVTSGPLPTNVPALLNAPSMNALMRRLTNDYDIVLFDTPPLLEVTDPTIIANEGAGVILVVKNGKTSNEKIIESKRLLDLSRVRLIGSILNNKRA